MNDHINQRVSATGAITTNPVRKLARRLENRPDLRGGRGSSSKGVFILAIKWLIQGLFKLKMGARQWGIGLNSDLIAWLLRPARHQLPEFGAKEGEVCYGIFSNHRVKLKGIRSKAMANIVVDPGHGGSSNIGGSSWNNAVGPNGTLEKRLTLDVGNRLFSTLRLRGHSVWMTRDGDNNLGLATRAKLSKQKDAKVFVSLHFNGSTNHNAQGTETLVHTHYSSLSAELSIAIQDALLVITKLKDRNLSYSPSRIKPQSLGVLRPSRHRKSAAACLVEVRVRTY
jgi:N-acetylmuramoyl-L-alanine amidase